MRRLINRRGLSAILVCFAFSVGFGYGCGDDARGGEEADEFELGSDAGPETGGRSSGRAGRGDANPVPLEKLPAEYARAHCGKLFRCCSSKEVKTYHSHIPVEDVGSESECRGSYEQLFEQFQIGDIRKAVDAGRATYDAEAVGDCIAKIESFDCGSIPSGDAREYGTVCERSIQGRVELGDSCKRNFECEQGVCRRDGGSEFGTCTKLSKEADPCASTDCSAGEYCDDERGICVERESEGATCRVDGECSTGRCASNGDGELVCTPKKEAGEACTANDECRSGICTSDNQDEGSCLPAPACDGE